MKKGASFKRVVRSRFSMFLQEARLMGERAYSLSPRVTASIIGDVMTNLMADMVRNLSGSRLSNADAKALLMGIAACAITGYPLDRIKVQIVVRGKGRRKRKGDAR